MVECNNSNGNENNCPPKVIPIPKVEKETIQAFRYSRLVNNAFGTTNCGYRSKNKL